MKKSVGVAITLAVVASAAGVGAQLKGSDTLEVFTEEFLTPGTGSTCQEAIDLGLYYDGGGSSSGENAMMAVEQDIAPMSRALSNKLCSDPDVDVHEAEQFSVALDGIAISIGHRHNVSSCGGTGTWADPDQDGTACLAETGTINLPGGGTYTIQDWKDVLRIVFAGMDHDAGKDVGNKNCGSAVRQALVDSWGTLFDNNVCDNCTTLKHAYRRADLSGTTDTFLSLLGLPGIGDAPFCNGTEQEDLDAIRRPCDGATDDPGPSGQPSGGDLVCEKDGTLGLVLPVFVVERAEPFEVTEVFPGSSCQGDAEKACARGTFALAPAWLTPLGPGRVYACPETALGFNIGTNCLAPMTAPVQCSVPDGFDANCPHTAGTTPTNCRVDQFSGVPYCTKGDFDCVSKQNNRNAYMSAGDDGRVFNKYVRDVFGKLQLDANGNPNINAIYRQRQNQCCLESSTLQIGCLTGHVSCTIGYAGLESVTDTVELGSSDDQFYPPMDNVAPAQLFEVTDPLCVHGVQPSVGTIRDFSYVLSRYLWVNTTVGFENVNPANGGYEGEDELQRCMHSRSAVEAAATAAGFVTLGTAPQCVDYDEQTLCGVANVDACAVTEPVTQ